MQQPSRAVAVGLAVFAVSASLVLTATPASAAPGMTVTNAKSNSTPAAAKTVSAPCPAGSHIYGGGGDIVNGAHSVSITALKPVHNGSAEAFVATAEVNEGGYASGWTLYSYAICGPAIPGLQLVSFTSVSVSSNSISTYAQCPFGKAPIGQGAEVIGGHGQVALTNLSHEYDSSLSAGLAQGSEDLNGFSGNWSLAAFAVCANPPPGLSYVTGYSLLNSLDKSATVDCPAGTRVYSVGAVTDIFQHFDGLTPHGANWTGADLDTREDQVGVSYNWQARVIATCAV